MITTVSSSATLLTAIQNAKPGDTIALVAGSYSTLSLTNVNIAGTVTITSADPGHPAVIAGVSVGFSSGLSFHDLEITMDIRTGTAVTVGNSHDISFGGLDVHGGFVGDGNGALVRNSNNVTIKDSEFHNIGTGISHINTSGVVINNNSIHDLQADAIHGGGSSNITISGNQFTNFYPKVGDHPDAIQFWTTYTTVSAHDIVIKDNVFVRGAGDPAQGIFMGNEWGLTYKNVTISGNAVVGGMYNGIAITMADNVHISGNLVEGFVDMNSWISVTKSTAVQIDNNVATSYATSFSLPGVTTWANSSISPGAIGDATLLNSWLVAHGTTLAQPLPIPISPDPIVTINDADGDGRIQGGSGADVLGGAGADTMSGGAGNDTYLVDVAGDRITEVPTLGGGIDTVRTIVSTYTLPTGVENLMLTGTGSQVGIGNTAANVITSNGVLCDLRGGDGNDTLVSMGGTETLTGGAGADLFRFDRMPVNAAKITDFVDGADQIDLGNLLATYTGTNPEADGWVKFTVDAGGTNVMVDIDGPTGSAAFVTVAKLAGVTSALTVGSDWLF